jgi:Domain of unknown function (DUF4386)
MQNAGRRVGIIYLLYFVIAMLGEGLSSSGHAATGTAVAIASYLWYAVLTFALYRLFRPAGGGIMIVAALASWAGCVIGVARMLHLIGSALDPLLFFGTFCLLLGYVLWRPAPVPRAIAALLVAAGIGWIVFSLAHVAAITPYVQGLGILAELALMFWLLAFGVRSQNYERVD